MSYHNTSSPTTPTQTTTSPQGQAAPVGPQVQTAPTVMQVQTAPTVMQRQIIPVDPRGQAARIGVQGQAAPAGYHYMPDGSLMLDSDMQSQNAPDGYHYMPDGSLMLNSQHGNLGFDNINIELPIEIDNVNTELPIEIDSRKTIQSFDIDTRNISKDGEARVFTIVGDKGAVFSLEVKNGANYYNFSTNLFQATQTRLNDISINNIYTGVINFPRSAAGDKFDIYLFADSAKDTKHTTYIESRFPDGNIDINSSQGSNSNLLQKVIYQTLDTTITINGYSPNSTITGTNTTSATIIAERDKNVLKVPFTHVFTVTSTRTLSINKQPVDSDIMAFVTRDIGAAPASIPGEDIYPTATAAFTGDDVNGAVTSGAVVRMDNTDLSAVIAVGDKITTTVMTDTVDGGIESGIKVVMDTAVAERMAVGDQVTGNTAFDSKVVTVAALNPDGDNVKEFSLSEAIVVVDGTTLSFSSKINRSLTTVTVVETSGTATDFTMSQDIQFRDNAPLTFHNQRNYRWPVDNIDLLKSGMIVLGDATTNGFTGNAKIEKYLDKTTIFENSLNEYKVTNVEVSASDTLSVKPTLSRDSTTKVVTKTQTGNIVFSQQSLLTFAGVTAKIFAYGPSEINRLTGYDIEFSDLAIALTEVSTTTTAAVNASTSVPITTRAGIMDLISSVSGIGINPAVANPTVASGAGSVTGAGTIVLSAAQTLESGTTLTFPGASTIATITGNIKVNNVGNEDVTLRFDLEKLLTMH